MTDKGWGNVHHVGLVVADRDRALEFLSGTLQADGFRLDTAAPEGMVSDEGTGFRVAVGFVRLGNMLLEVIQPLDDRSPHAAFLAERGEGMHHIAFSVPALSDHLPRFTDAGCRIILDGTSSDSPMRVVYLQGEPAGGIVLELMEPTPALDQFWQTVDDGLVGG